eukprot:TRINITY_DN1103_c1_g1_i1.p1 TRINITY_DN1103_c1_g1~~TRINITY_DN1103_c1_g1_i1.p1  ORF type:complete len:458 (-),score=123.02 TRINITY_DN1103_c1_g1_i1:169-1542(-)
MAMPLQLPINLAEQRAVTDACDDLPDGTPNSSCYQSPMARWMEPCRAQDCPQPAWNGAEQLPQQQLSPPQQQVHMQMPQQLPQQQQQQMVWVYMVPVSAAPAAAMRPTAVQQAPATFGWQASTSSNTASTTCNTTDDSSNTSCNASDAGSNEQGARLTNSAARRRRRQRAAAFAKEEEVQRSLAEAAGEVFVPSLRTKSFSSHHVGLTSERCSQLMEKVLAGGEALEEALEDMRGSVRALTLDNAGCRVVQAVIEHAPVAVVSELLQELKGSVRKAAHNPYGNFVIQKVIELLPWTVTQFVIQELLQHASQTARHQYGCRTMCRISEHCMANPDAVRLFDELVVNAGTFCRHEYAHYVMEAMMEHGVEKHKAAVSLFLEQELLCSRVNRSLLYVLDAAIRHGPAEMASRLLAAKETQNFQHLAPQQQMPQCLPMNHMGCAPGDARGFLPGAQQLRVC